MRSDFLHLYVLLSLMASKTLMPVHCVTIVTIKPQHTLSSLGAQSLKPASTVTATLFEENIGAQSSQKASASFDSDMATFGKTSTSFTKSSTLTLQTTAKRTDAIDTTQDYRSNKVSGSSTMQNTPINATGNGSTSGSTNIPKVLISTATSITQRGEFNSDSTSLTTQVDGLAELTSSYQSLVGTQHVHITKKKQSSGNGIKQHQKKNPSKVVAGIICGALTLMVVGFVLIYIKRQKIRKQQLTTNDWAGPSPFLDSGEYNGQVEVRASNQISLASFTPQILMLPERDKEQVKMAPGSTFGQEEDGDKTKETKEDAYDIAGKQEGTIIPATSGSDHAAT